MNSETMNVQADKDESHSFPSKADAALDLGFVFSIVMATWSLRFLDIPQVGPLTMAVALAGVFGVLYFRDQPLTSIGLLPLPPFTDILRSSGRLLPWFGGAYVLGAVIGVGLFGQPETASAITEQSESFWRFLLDLTLVTWVLIAFGEEVVFRGFTLGRLMVFTGSETSGRLTAAIAQAIWFGSLHASQGAAGMIMTGTIGLAFAWFYLSKPARTLWPLILVHALADTMLLSVAWLFKG
jgi:membrane protease YdiL (CAAX protease family)